MALIPIYENEEITYKNSEEIKELKTVENALKTLKHTKVEASYKTINKISELFTNLLIEADKIENGVMAYDKNECLNIIAGITHYISDYKYDNYLLKICDLLRIIYKDLLENKGLNLQAIEILESVLINGNRPKKYQFQ